MSSRVGLSPSWTPMLALSAPSRVSGWVSGARVSVSGGRSSPALTSRSYICLHSSVRSSLRCCPCGIYSSRAMAVAEAAESKAARGLRSAMRRAFLTSDMGAEEEVGHSWPFLRAEAAETKAARGLRSAMRRAVLTSDMGAEEEVGHSRSFLRSWSEQELNKNIITSQILQSGDPSANEITLSNMAVAFDHILLDVKDLFVFSSHHEAIREPFDYYMFGQNFI